MHLADPLGKLCGIRHGIREKNHFDSRGKENYVFLPHNPPQSVLHVVNLVIDDPGRLFQNLGTLIEHPSKNIHGHNEE